MDDTSIDTWDLIVVGAGAVGENVADYATKGGLRSVVVEAGLVGGECSYRACMPSKALLRPAAVRLAAQRVAGASAAVTGDLDVAAVLERRTKFTNDWDDAGQVSWLDSAGIDIVRGRGRIVGERTVDVTQADGTVRRLTATHAVAVCTGSMSESSQDASWRGPPSSLDPSAACSRGPRLKPSHREDAYRGPSAVIPDRPGQTLTNTVSISAPAGFGIVEQVFLREDDLSPDTAQQQREFLNHHRAALIQIAFLEPRLRTVGRLDTIHLPSLIDLVFDETWPLLQSDLDSVSYMFDSVETHGQTLRYRDVTFLFSGLGWDQSPDFLLWRLPEVAPGIAWPDVESIAGPPAD